MTKIIKKILMLCLPVALLMASTSCSKDSDSSSQNLQQSLVGTSWQSNDGGNQILMIFTTATTGTVVLEGQTASFTYTYSNGSGIATAMGTTVTFTVTGDTMILTDARGDRHTLARIGGGSDNGSGNGGGGSVSTSLVGTTWQLDGYPGVKIVFSTATTGILYDDQNASFTYTYSNGSGTMTLAGKTITFSVSGNKLYLYKSDGSGALVFTLAEGGGGGGAPSASLVGTTWTYTEVGGSHVELTRLAFVTATNVTLTIYEDGAIQYNVTTTYAYNSSTGSGILYAPAGQTGDISFIVSGNYLIAGEIVFQKE